MGPSETVMVAVQNKMKHVYRLVGTGTERNECKKCHFFSPQSTIQKELYFLFPRSTKSAERKSLNLHRDVNLKQGLYSRHKFGKTERPFPRPGKFVENVFCGARCWKVGEFHDHGQQRLQKGDKYLTCIIARPRDCSVTHTVEKEEEKRLGK